LTEVRGIREIVSAMGLLEGRAELWLMGSWGTPTLEAACRALPGWKHTRFLGRRPLEDVYARMKAASVGLHMPYAVGGYSSGLAIKGFEYMACRLPMVMTDEPAKRQTFGECALFADARHPASIAARIRELLDRPGRARRLGERGRSLVEERYSWAKEAEKLIALYDRLL
jgi:glycosyltransferase involved in cell wall biosynthesis